MSQNSEAPFVLVDGSSYLFRAFHGMPPMSNSQGQATHAIYGVINMLKSLLKTYEPTHIAVVFDAKGKTFRDDIYPEYKANRPPMPDELRSQIAPLHAIIKAMGLPLIVEPNVEADDVIGTLTKRATALGMKSLVSTGDKDMAQLVDDHVTLINTMNNTLMDVPGVVEKFGIGPELIIDFLALKGDKVDNIPGVPGVGDKSALGLLQGIGGINDIYNNLDKIATLDFRGAKTMAKKMQEHEQSARLSYELATIAIDLPLDYSPDQLSIKDADNNALAELFQTYEFKRWFTEVTGDTFAKAPHNKNNNNDSPVSESTPANAVTSNTPKIDHTKYDVVLTEAALAQWIEKCSSAPLFGLQTFTSSAHYMEAQIVGISLCVAAGDACYIPLLHDYPDAPEQLNSQWALEQLTPLLKNSKNQKVGHNLKFDKNVLANHGITLNGVAYDTMLESYVLNSVVTKHHIEALSLHYLGHSPITLESIAGKGAKQLTFNQIGLAEAAPFAAENADIILRLHQLLWPQLVNAPELANVVSELEVPLSQVLSRMEQTGVLIDSQKLAQQSQSLAERILHLEETVHEMAGEAFNLGSTKQLQHILFEKMNLPVIKKTPKGAPSTGEEVLQELALNYPLPKAIMEYRGLTKLKNTYTDKLPKLIDHRTGRVHTSYQQAITATGRLSSTDPNLQNIPIRTEEGRKVREAFIARPGYKIVAADYSQIELRIMAHLSSDSGLLHAFANGLDVHKATASEVFGVALEHVTSEQRRSSKAINFGLIYGMSAFGLAKQLNIPRGDAQHYMDTYFERYPGVLQYMQDTREEAKAQGYVKTVFGRRLYLPEITSSNGARRAGAERAAINAPMQGTAADIIKLSMLAVDNWIQTQDQSDICMIMQVHDELIFEIKEQKVDAYSTKIIELMENAVSLAVPLTVEFDVGENWEQAH
ncbi:DNA polymerase I [Glaciecola sp. HTCC2999]|jgi:DNA polymerase-1|uniref:DNA polymerase I n=1 Tax=Glaciecola sp. HTCC2999 TaxID=455436 RepID=UPI0000E0DBDC|nr:DNA polymerase I [Glaciecola sp. HTCC2999]